MRKASLAILTLLAVAVLAPSNFADQVIADDQIVTGSQCVGFDCVNGENFGFDTVRLKENNLRLKFDDTSSSGSFPNNDWQLTANDTTNGGANRFSIDDITGSKTPFTIEAGTPSHTLYVDSGGKIGIKTNTPVVDLHVKTGNTPTLRLEQDGSAGFTPQTWDLAGNEANFFVRDVTGGSTLPFRLFPKAPTNSLTVEGTTGDVGVGTNNPEASMHIKRTAGFAGLRLDNGSVQWDVRSTNANGIGFTKFGSGKLEFEITEVGTGTQILIDGNGDSSTIRLQNGASGSEVNWDIQTTASGGLAISKLGSGKVELELDASGNVTIGGNLTVTGSCFGCTP